MKSYKKEITLNKNSRGCFILDTIKGCQTCLKNNENGCYGECYAKNIADRYGFDFSRSTKRDFKSYDRQLMFFDFKDESHLSSVIKKIKKSEALFIRIGEMGDPSEDWDHTIKICEQISCAGKPIVIVTKHWNILSDEFLKKIKKMNICINTSISALDTEEQFSHRISQFYRLKPFCKSVLRVVSCDFNKENEEGLSRSILQDELFSHVPNIDTIFRCKKTNPLVLNDVIKIKKIKFLSSFVYASVFNKKTYFGLCNECPDMCGINL